ncbi:MAG: clostripain-related cysteine peptidase [Prevotellaceae bacterium]|nr:clostripain-related cysteine peptidase [Prevotellaceae bacterium]MDY6130684.1 clostripain-related cysteine peptidase [Prevotella sp.]
MKKIVFIAIMSVMMLACGHKDDPEPVVAPAEQTVLMYLPWSGSTIYREFLKNITAMKTAIEYRKGLGNKKFLVLIASSSTKANLINVRYENDRCVNDTIKKYTVGYSDFTTEAGLVKLLNDVKDMAPARSYGLVIGCHGMGWLPAGKYAGAKKDGSAFGTAKLFGDKEKILTRWFGNGEDSDERYQAEIYTLASAIKNSFGHTDYILFDDCYMANIEVAYELKGVTDWLIASTSEVMLAGMPYATIGNDILNKNYENIVDGFYKFYKDYKNPYGTLAAINMAEVDNTAALMKQINRKFEYEGDGYELQKLDGYSPTVFFDMGDYVKHLCKDEALYNQFAAQMEKLVPYKKHTEFFYSMASRGKSFVINAFSGITISDPSTHRDAAGKTSTAWWAATH